MVSAPRPFQCPLQFAWFCVIRRRNLFGKKSSLKVWPCNASIRQFRIIFDSVPVALKTTSAAGRPSTIVAVKITPFTCGTVLYCLALLIACLKYRRLNLKSQVKSCVNWLLRCVADARFAASESKTEVINSLNSDRETSIWRQYEKGWR